MAESDRGDPPIDLSAGRLEAFSDAVIAVIITILALSLHPPATTVWPDVRHALATLAIYVLSFMFIAIYWNNHHHLLRATTRISAGVMWANMALLFCLSLIPVTTEWQLRSYDPRHPWPVVFFGVVALAAGLAYTVLVRMIIRANCADSVVAMAIHADRKGNISLGLYAAGVALAFVYVFLAYACYAAVSVMWLVPDRRFMHRHDVDDRA